MCVCVYVCVRAWVCVCECMCVWVCACLWSVLGPRRSIGDAYAALREIRTRYFGEDGGEIALRRAFQHELVRHGWRRFGDYSVTPSR